MKKKILNSMMKYSFKKGYFICLSNIAAKDIVDFVNRNQILIVNNGIEPVLLEKEEIIRPSDITNILFISNLRVEKGVFDLLKIYKKIINSTNQKVNLTIIGEEGDITYNDLRKIITEEELPNINLLGPKYGAEKYDLFKSSNLFLFPTLNEVFPGVILEAMEFGLPIVTTNVGAIEDILNENNGIVCQANDIDAMSSAALSIINNQELSVRLGQNAKKDFYNKYTLTKFESNMRDVFTSIIAQNEVSK